MRPTLPTLFLALSLAGCADTRFLENRIVCTVDKQHAHAVSVWGPFGISSRIAASDAAIVCRPDAPQTKAPA